MDIDVRILFPNMMEEVDIPREWQFRMMPALHQDLHAAGRGKFIQLFIDLLKAKNVMIRSEYDGGGRHTTRMAISDDARPASGFARRRPRKVHPAFHRSAQS